MSEFGLVGQGAVISFSSDAAIGRVRSAQLPEWLAPRVDFTSLADLSWLKFLAGSPTDSGQMVLDIFFDTQIAIPTLRLVQTATITFPYQRPNGTANATLTGTGFFTTIGFGNLQSAQPLMRGATFAFDGGDSEDTGAPTFTLEVSGP